MEHARLTNAPDAEYNRAYGFAGGAVADVQQEAHTTDESIYATQVAKPLRARMYSEGLEFSRELTRRTNARIKAAFPGTTQPK